MSPSASPSWRRTNASMAADERPCSNGALACGRVCGHPLVTRPGDGPCSCPSCLPATHLRPASVAQQVKAGFGAPLSCATCRGVTIWLHPVAANNPLLCYCRVWSWPSVVGWPPTYACAKTSFPCLPVPLYRAVREIHTYVGLDHSKPAYILGAYLAGLDGHFAEPVYLSQISIPAPEGEFTWAETMPPTANNAGLLGLWNIVWQTCWVRLPEFRP